MITKVGKPSDLKEKTGLQPCFFNLEMKLQGESTRQDIRK
jgi:hypothetical protein